VTFKKGQSGNPKGGVRGKPRKSTQYVRDLVMPAAPKIIGTTSRAANKVVVPCRL
jgi:hypothetical protein